MSRQPYTRAKGRVIAGNLLAYVVLSVLCVIWLVPVAWLVIISFSKGVAGIPNYFWPKYGFTVQNYVKLFKDSGAASGFYFPRWFLNTLFVSICSCALSSVMVLSVAYAVSRMRFRLRKPFLNTALVLGMFPGFMSMIAVYYILKAVSLTNTLVALILVYSGGAGLGFYVAKGFFDAIPKEMDEAAMIDGATRSQIFWQITVPLSKPVIVYTILISFLAPWADFIFVNMIMGPTAYKNYTVALGLFRMIDREHITTYFSMFAAGAVLVSIPIVALFISLQRFYIEGITGGSVKG
jgi:arabinogalactan oligomer/maltooligosaccharide transport system permease protein